MVLELSPRRDKQSADGYRGDRSGGYDRIGATKLTFWARGDAGGEVVSFQFGIIPKDKRFFDTAKGTLDKVTLTSEGRQYEIPASGQDLTRIKTGFVWTMASAGKPSFSTWIMCAGSEAGGRASARATQER